MLPEADELAKNPMVLPPITDEDDQQKYKDLRLAS